MSDNADLPGIPAKPKRKEKPPVKRIKDLDPNQSLSGVRFKGPNGEKGYWVSQWGYDDGKAGVWYKEKLSDTRIHPIFLDDLREAMEWEVME